MNDEYNVARFQVAENFARNCPNMVAQVFALLELVPYRVELLAHNRTFEYIAKSPMFPPSNEGYEIPEVNIIPDIGDDGEVKHIQVIDVSGKHWSEKKALGV